MNPPRHSAVMHPDWREDLRDKEGRRLCKMCLKPVAPRRSRYCSKACATDYEVRISPSQAQWHVGRRDRGVCALCGKKTKNWEVDHIVPVAEGGGSCGLSNLRTLCVSCHRQRTAEWQAARARERRKRRAARLRDPAQMALFE